MESYLSHLLDSEQLVALETVERATREERHALLAARKELARAVHDGAELAQLEETREIREDASWRVAPPPADLTYRLVELATPATAEAATGALASGADVWVADLEDMLVPTHRRLEAAQRVIAEVATTRTGDARPQVPTLMVRPRGLHLDEAHAQVDGEVLSAAVADVVPFLALSARTLLANGTGPYLYLPKLETWQEARWWDAMITRAEEALGLPSGCTRVSVLVETVQAAYQLEEILYALRERVTGLAAGRWDYVFSYLRLYGHRPDHALPDRDAFTMNTRFLRTYTDVIVRTCHRRGVQAVGGPVTLAPTGPFDESVAMTHARIHRDKAREAKQGFDGAWAVHPGMVPVVREPFEDRDEAVGTGAQERLSGGQEVTVTVDPSALRDVSALPGSATLTGMRTALRSSLAYLTGWLAGEGTLVHHGHIEDFGTVELARMQLWQWMAHGQRFAEGPTMSPLLLERVLEDEVNLLRRRGAREDLLGRAVALLRESVLAEEPPAFLAVKAYELLMQLGEPAQDGGDESDAA
ncbi:aldolase/citrate lyase family protein [Ornithinimicrobium tianjinense]|uniref:malate synthase n=1 Tax=Ornithinimicrobium tianjinense TaxID=1195761 RepID=A0A917BL32_9MICO|nr:aldolase/citrate lyase family protein [Ornithinimicrobium tianjinense]GGF50278.1 malate synthase [Ornithinimicrobium tianjinense]